MPVPETYILVPRLVALRALVREIIPNTIPTHRLEILWTYSLAIAIQLVFRFWGKFDFEGEIFKRKKKRNFWILKFFKILKILDSSL